MNKLAIVSASAITMLAAGLVLAHGDHKSEHGGNVGRGSDEIVVEFVMEKGTLKLYVHDDAGNPIETGKVDGNADRHLASASCPTGEAGRGRRASIERAGRRSGPGRPLEGAHHASQRRRVRVGGIVRSRQSRQGETRLRPRPLRHPAALPQRIPSDRGRANTLAKRIDCRCVRARVEATRAAQKNGSMHGASSRSIVQQRRSSLKDRVAPALLRSSFVRCCHWMGGQEPLELTINCAHPVSCRMSMPAPLRSTTYM